MTTFAVLELSAKAYDEIATKLRKVGYAHAIRSDGIIDASELGFSRIGPSGPTIHYDGPPHTDQHHDEHGDFGQADGHELHTDGFGG